MRLKFIFLLTVTSSSFAQNDFVFSNGFESPNDSIFANGFESTTCFPPPLGVLNDTGITFAVDTPTTQVSVCSNSSLASPQDCNAGRDFTHNDDSDGHAGFNFTKFNDSCTPLADQSVNYATTPWACVRDNVTGLIWEVKTNDAGLHDRDDKYNWYNTNSLTNGGGISAGYEDNNGNICSGYDVSDSATYCNTQAYVARVNAEGLCGYNDWRLPDINELYSIVDQGISFSLSIDTNYFPNTSLGFIDFYWSSTPIVNEDTDPLLQKARNVNFSSDQSFFFHYNEMGKVRLVRGGQ